MLDHLQGCLMAYWHGNDEGQQSQYYGKDEGFWQIFLNQFYTKTYDSLKHNFLKLILYFF